MPFRLTGHDLRHSNLCPHKGGSYFAAGEYNPTFHSSCGQCLSEEAADRESPGPLREIQSVCSVKAAPLCSHTSSVILMVPA